MEMILEKLGALKEERSMKNLFTIICSHGDSVAAEYLDEGIVKKLTYADYERISVAAAGKLAQLMDGTEKNTFVALRLPNNPLWAAAFWGIIMAGYRPLLVDGNADDAAVMHILRQAGSRTIVSDSPVSVGGVTAIKTDDFLDIHTSDTSYMPVFSDAIALCTSGTTATPKVYVYNEQAVCDQVLLAEYIYKNNKDIIHNGPIKQLAFLPFHHIFGLMAVYMWYTFFGKTIVYIKNRTADVILDACKTHKVTHIYAVPLLWNNVAKGILRKARLQGEETYDKLINASDLSIKIQRRLGKTGRKLVSNLFFKDLQQRLVGDSIQFMISGGGHIQPETLKIINSIGYPLVSGFGMTETGIDSVELSDSIDRKLDASVGKPFFPMEYRIVRENAGDKTGELQIRGDAIHSGRMVDGVYIAREEGWFSSGDIVREVDGRYYIEGRLKDVIINESGENVYPDELEDSFSELPYAEHICVTGVAAKDIYDDTALVVYMGENTGDSNKTAELISEITRVNGLLPIYKKIKRVFLALEPLPLANGIKVRRLKVKEALERGQGRFDEIDIRGGAVKHTAVKKDQPAVKPNGTSYDSKEYQSIVDNVRQVFADVLGIEASSIKDTDHFIDDLGGDSLSSLGVFSKAEEMYDVIIPDTEYFSCATVEDLSRLLYKKLNNLEDFREEAKPMQELRKITSFAASREYEEYARRRIGMKDAGIKDPYFVAHDSVLSDTSVVRGREIINLASYNYVGMSGHPRTAEAAKAAIDTYGTSASGSRLIAGEKTLFRDLERAIAAWKHTDDALVLVGGHSTNVTFVGNFCNEHDLVLYDALSHNSITQGCQLSKSDTKAFPHNDIDALEYLLKAARDKYEKILVVVEGVYSMDGDIAPIPEFVALKKKYGAFLMVDEAHSSCVIGKKGNGVDDYFNLLPGDIDVKMGTLSKGLGTCGGYIAGEQALVDYMRYSLPGFMFSVGISPPLAAAALEGVKIMMEGNPKVNALHKNIEYFVEGAKRRGFDTCLAKETAIIPIMVGEDNDAYELSTLMLEEGVFVPPAVYPAVPKRQARLRFCVISEHKPEQLDYALDTLDKLFAQKGISKQVKA